MTLETFTANHIRQGVESWKADHDSAMVCFSLEEWIAVGLYVFGICEGLNDRIRKLVYSGLLEPSDPIIEDCRMLYESWLAKARTGSAQIVKCKSEFGAVERSADFESATTRAETLLQKWTPIQSASVGMRPHSLDEEEAQELIELMNAPPGSPGTLSRPLAMLEPASESLMERMRQGR